MTNDINAATPDILDGVFGETSVVFYTAAAEGDFALSYVSRNIGRVLGVPPEACVGRAAFWRERIHVEDTRRVLDELDGLIAGDSRAQEFRFRDDRNNYRWVCNEVAFKHKVNGASVYLAGCLRDISEIKNCMAELSNNLKEQSAREYFYRSVLDSVPQRLFWKDRRSVFRGCNLSGARALKLSRTNEIDGKSDYDFFSDDEANYLQLQDQQIMDSGQASYHAEVPIRQANTWLDVTKVPLRDEKGEVYGLLISYEDITVRKRVEEEVTRYAHDMNERIKEISCLRDITMLSQNAGVSIARILNDCVRRMPDAWLCPSHTCARIRLGNLAVESPNFQETEWKLAAAIPLATKEFGVVEVFYKGNENEAVKNPFLDEEHALINSIAIQLSQSLERRWAEEALAESEARLREIAGTVGEGIYVVDSTGIITFANPAAAKLLGWDSKYLLGKNACDIINCSVQNDQYECGTQGNEDHAAKIKHCWLDKTKRLRKTLRIENAFFKRKDGSRFQVSIIAAPIFHSLKITGTVVAFHDITEQKFTQKLLADTLLKLHTVLDNAQIGVAHLRKNEFVWINKHMKQMFGYTANYLIGKPMGAIYATDADVPNSLTGEVCDLLNKGEVYENERLMKKSTGETFWCHQRGIAIDPNDPDKGSIWIILDIDRLKKTENHLKALNKTLAQRVAEETQKSLEKERLFIQQGRNAAMGEMIGNIAHQWRQPLSTLGLVIQNILSDYQEGILNESALNKYVNKAEQAIRRMSSTIDDFRNFFKPNRTKERFSIYQSICETIQLLDAMLKSNGIAIRLTGNRELQILGHSNEFSQVILNFIANAKDALVDRKVTQGCINIELAGRDGYGFVSIRDNAGGIPEDKLEKVFDPYFTTKPTGTGIGLHISKTIIEKHMNGKIDFRNTSEGAEFTITVPLADGDAHSKHSEISQDAFHAPLLKNDSSY